MTDHSGAFRRWINAIPAIAPHPVKSATSSVTRSVQRRPSLSLFDDDSASAEKPENQGVQDEDMDNLDELDPIDWIADDVSEPDEANGDQGFVKEMGLLPRLVVYKRLTRFCVH